MRLTCKQDGENQNQPDTGSLDSLDTGDSENGNFGARVEAEAENDAERVHLPRAIDGLEEKPEDSGHEAAALEAKLPTGRRLGVVL